MQTVLVLGASGFIGRRIVSALAATDWARPVAASRGGSPLQGAGDIETVRLDATNSTQLAPAVAAADNVICCVAGEPRDIRESGRALFELASRRPVPPRVVWLSSLAAYGSTRGTVDEGSALRGDLGPYSAAKASIDALAAGFPFVTRLRPGIVYGPRSPWWSDRIARLLVTRRLGDLGTAGAGICNLVHVDDVAAAALRALRLEAAGGEAFNLGSPLPPTWNGYFHLYAAALGAAPLARIPRARLIFELRVRGPMLKVAERLFGGRAFLEASPPIRPWLARLCRHEIRLDVSKAEQVLGMRWRPAEEGLAQTASWFRAGGRTP